MTEAEVEAVLLETVRRYTARESVEPQSLFDADLRLSEAGRQMLFASLAQAFAARGTSLASHGFLLGDFFACPTPAAARDAIRVKVFGAPARAKPAAPAHPAPAAGAAESQQTPRAGANPKKPKSSAKKSPPAKKSPKPRRRAA